MARKLRVQYPRAIYRSINVVNPGSFPAQDEASLDTGKQPRLRAQGLRGLRTGKMRSHSGSTLFFLHLHQ